jgi:hypothetical protein
MAAPLSQTYPFAKGENPYLHGVETPGGPVVSSTAQAAQRALGDVDTAAEAQKAEQKDLQKASYISLMEYRFNKTVYRTNLVFWALLKTLVALSLGGAAWKLAKMTAAIYQGPSQRLTKLFGVSFFGGLSAVITTYATRLILHSVQDARLGWNKLKVHKTLPPKKSSD